MHSNDHAVPKCRCPMFSRSKMGAGRPLPREKERDPYDGLRPWSAITHGIGAVFAVIGTILLLVRTVSVGGDIWKVVSFSIYGFSMICLYSASTLYHCMRTSVSGRIALRKYDHCSIYLLIAGTYTPICLIALRGAWGWSLFGVIWGLAIVGCAMAVLWINCPRWLTSAIYIGMGWLAIIAIYPLWLATGATGVFWLLFGGLLYTVGGIFYALKWPGRDCPRFGCHEIFHVFIVLGSIAQYVLVAVVLLPM